jgi:AcrR family transcriptional regulator
MTKGSPKPKPEKAVVRRQRDAVRDRRSWEKALRQERIIDLAGKLFCCEDYHSITMERMAGLAGYCKRTLYLYFRDKEDLFAAVVLRHLKAVNAMLRENEQRAPGGLERFRGIAEVYFRFCIDDPQSFNLLFLFDHMNRYYRRHTDKDRQGNFKAECQKVADENVDFVIRAIEAAVREGAIEITLTPLQLMLLLWSQLSGVLDVILTRKQILQDVYDISPEAFYRSFIDQVWKSLVPSKSA